MEVTRLIVGGTRAGEVITVDDDMRDIMLPSALKLSMQDLSKVAHGEMPRLSTRPIEHYTLKYIQSGNREFGVFVLGGVDLFSELLNGYRPSVARITE